MRRNPSPLSLILFLLLPQEGRTALIWASENGHASIVEKLLAAGASPNCQDKVRNLVTRVIVFHVLNAVGTVVYNHWTGLVDWTGGLDL